MRQSAVGLFSAAGRARICRSCLLLSALLFVFRPAGEKAIYFSPAEVDFLFPAPFHRRELLIYKLAKTLVGLVFMALIFSVSFLIYLNVVALGVRRHLSDAGIHATAGDDDGVPGPDRGRTCLYAPAGGSFCWRSACLVLAGLAQMLWQTPIQSPSELARSFRSIMDRDGPAGAFRGFQPRDPGRQLFSRPGLLGRGGAGDRPRLADPDPQARRRLSRSRPPRSARSSTNECNG